MLMSVPVHQHHQSSLLMVVLQGPHQCLRTYPGCPVLPGSGCRGGCLLQTLTHQVCMSTHRVAWVLLVVVHDATWDCETCTVCAEARRGDSVTFAARWSCSWLSAVYSVSRESPNMSLVCCLMVMSPAGCLQVTALLWWLMGRASCLAGKMCNSIMVACQQQPRTSPQTSMMPPAAPIP